MNRRRFLAGTATAVGFSGCLAGDNADEPSVVEATLRLATATSTYDTGLLEELNAAFTARFGASVEVLSQGTGAALETGRRGDCDIVLVHARSLEDAFLREGYGVNRRDVMFNDFVVVGPPGDPAGLADRSLLDAFERLAESESQFLSRGDNSGTHVAEQDIWAAAGIQPEGDWYRETGRGAGELLVQTNLEDEAYTLTDRGTYLSMRAQLELVIHVEGPIEGGPELLANPYGIVAVNPGRHDNVAYDLAMAYIGFLTSRAAQEIIGEFSVDGQQLFFPDALVAEPRFEQYVPSDWQRGDG